MTVIAAIYEHDGVHLASDTRGCIGNEIVRTRKIFEAGRFTFGLAGFSAARGLVEDVLEAEPNPAYWRAAALPILPEHGFQLNEEAGCPVSIDMECLVTDGVTIWRLGGDFMAQEILRDQGYAAVGSGGPIALGALAAGADIREALDIASLHNARCGGPTDLRFVPRSYEPLEPPRPPATDAPNFAGY